MHPERSLESDSGPAPARRSVALALSLCAGIAIGNGAIDVHGAWLFALSAIVAACAAFARARASLVFLCAALALSGWAYFDLRIDRTDAQSISRSLSPDRALVAVEGRIVTAPRIEWTNPGALGAFVHRLEVTRFTVATDSIRTGDGARPVTGRLWVRIDEPAPSLRIGDRVELTGFASRLRAPANPGERDIRRLARERSIEGRITAPQASLCRVLDDKRSRVGSLLILPARARAHVVENARSWLEPDDGNREGRSLLRALMLGERDEHMDELSDDFARAGVAHVLAISGLHVGILAGACMLVVRLCGDRPVLESLVGIAGVSAYWFLVPASAPITRASIMALVFLIGRLAGRRYDPVTLLAWAMIGVLLWRPLQLFSPGFQLSFGIVCALILLAGPMRDAIFGEQLILEEPTLRSALKRRMKSLTGAYVCAWAVSVPLVAHHFGYISFAGLATSFLIVPLVGALLVVAFFALLVGTVVPGSGEFFAGVLAGPAQAIVEAVSMLDSIPGASVSTPPLSALWALGATLVVVHWMLRPHHHRLEQLVAAAISLAWLIGAGQSGRLPDDQLLRADMLSVGDGSCILVRSRSDAILYDCGSTYLAIGKRTIPDALRALGVWRVSTVVISHPNIDHYCALPDLIRPFGIERVLCTRRFLDQETRHPDGPVALVIREARSLGVEFIETSRDGVLDLGGCTGSFLAPDDSMRWARDNDSSLVLRFHCRTDAGDRSLLLCGDIERDAMEFLDSVEQGLGADIVEAPHHGSALPASLAFVDAVDPGVVLQSTGPRRIGDERWDEIKIGRIWLTTASDGASFGVIKGSGEIRAGSYSATNRRR